MDDTKKPSALRRFALKALAAAGVGAAILLSWWWKVDDARQPDEIPIASFGDPILLGRTTLTPHSLVVADGQIVLTASMENVTGETQMAVFGLPAKPPTLTIDGQPLQDPKIELVRDDEFLAQLEPRMAEMVRLEWPVPSGWTPQPIRIEFQRQQFKLRDNLYGQANWLGFSPVAVMNATPEVSP